MEQPFTDYLVETPNPKWLDQAINSYGGMLHCLPGEVYPQTPDGYYQMRVLGNPGFVEFMIKNQGYGKIIKKL